MLSRIATRKSTGTLCCVAATSMRRLFSQAGGSSTGGPAGETLAEDMRSKGFVNSTPNFSSDFSDAAADDSGATLSGDIVTSPATHIEFARDMYGPWLVMTDNLQGELFVDHDHFVFYRPANGLGYGVGKVETMDAATMGTAFTLQLEVYGYQPTATVAAEKGTHLEVTGMVKKVSSTASDYVTFSLIGIWSMPAGQEGGAATASDGKEKSTGQFNAAKLSPWTPTAKDRPWEPNQELQNVFREVFPKELKLTSHIKRAEAQVSDTPTTRSGILARQSKANHLDLSTYAVGSIPDIYYVPSYISEEEEQQIIDLVKTTPNELKNKLVKRTVQEWGCTMCNECEKSFVSDANMPPWVQQCTDMLTYDGIFTPSTFPNSVRIHEYETGEGIGPHCDGPIYVPMVTVLSLASTSVMSFYPKQEPYDSKPMEHYNDTFKFQEGSIGKLRPIQTVVLEPRSLLIFRSDAYYYHPHGVSDKAVDELSPEVAGEVVNRHLLRNREISAVERKYRVSLTTRNLLTRCNHQPSRAEYNMKRSWYIYNQLPLPKQLFTPGPIPFAPDNNEAASHVTGTGTLPTQQQTAVSTGSTVGSGPLTAEQLQRWESKLDAVFSQQAALGKAVEELKELVTVSLASDINYRKDTSVVLNNLTTSLLDVDSKLEDIIDSMPPQGSAK